MPKHIFHNVCISGMASAVPSKVVENIEFERILGKKMVEDVIAFTGIERFHRAERWQTAGDLAYTAAEKMLNELQIDRSKIGAVIDVTQTPDYIFPSTAFVLHKRLQLPQHCMAFDVNHGCTGFVYGIHIACSMLQCMEQKYVLLVVGDVPKWLSIDARKYPDTSNLMMFGDAAAVTLLEKMETEDCIITDIYGDGTDYKMLYHLGGCRCPDAPRDVTMWSDGIERSLYDPYMDGMRVFTFSTTYVPKAIHDFLREQKESLEDYESVYFPQANKFIIERMAKKLKLQMEKVPMSLSKYGNTLGASIPVTIIDTLGNDNSNKKQKILLCGFGVGLSWGCVSMYISPDVVFPMIISDDYYKEGEIYPF